MVAMPVLRINIELHGENRKKSVSPFSFLYTCRTLLCKQLKLFNDILNAFMSTYTYVNCLNINTGLIT